MINKKNLYNDNLSDKEESDVDVIFKFRNKVKKSKNK